MLNSREKYGNLFKNNTVLDKKIIFSGWSVLTYSQFVFLVDIDQIPFSLDIQSTQALLHFSIILLNKKEFPFKKLTIWWNSIMNYLIKLLNSKCAIRVFFIYATQLLPFETLTSLLISFCQFLSTKWLCKLCAILYL